MKKTLAKTIQGENGKLHITMEGNRYKLADCEPLIEIWEYADRIPMTGEKGYDIRRRCLSIVLCEDMDFTRPVDTALLRKVSVFGMTVDVQRPDGAFERLNLDTLAPVDIDLDGRWTFELVGQQEITKKLLAL